MPLLKIENLTAGLSREWSGYLRDWDRTLRAGNYPETTRNPICDFVGIRSRRTAVGQSRHRSAVGSSGWRPRTACAEHTMERSSDARNALG
jgi:hypothetical protein